MSRPQLFLGDKPIGYVNELTTRDAPPTGTGFCKTTTLYAQRYRVTTLWPAGIAACPLPAGGAATYIWHRDESGAETLEYVVPYGDQVSIGGLDEAHHAVVAEIKRARAR